MWREDAIRQLLIVMLLFIIFVFFVFLWFSILMKNMSIFYFH